MLPSTSCQNFEQGLFTAYEQMVRDDVDLVFHLGDYIYEYAAGARASVAYLDRDRRLNGIIERQDDVLASIGTRITTGFIFRTRLQIDYNYNFGVIRQGDFGGHEILFHWSKDF